MYSIIVELNKDNSKFKKGHKTALMFLFGFPIAYLIFAIIFLISGNFSIEIIMPFHLTSMLCVLLLIIWSTFSISDFEVRNKIKKTNGIGLFFGIWYNIFGVWYIQPKMNNYIEIII